MPVRTYWWAFQFEDLFANEIGFACADRKCESCEECCANGGPW
jgi:hypothetical protein